MSVSFALGLPHTPWIPARVESFGRLDDSLNASNGVCELTSRIFAEREPNWSWSQKLWHWAAETGATHLVQLQDDAIAAPAFWSKLRAMVSAVPDQVIGLEANHPLGPEQFRTGRRWYRTRAWLVGVGYVWPVAGLTKFLEWCKVNTERVQSTNEDTLASQYLAENKLDVWHPCPTIIDHDISVESTYGNDTHHEFSMYRRPTVTWRDVPRVEALDDPSYWLTTTEPPLLPGPGTQVCWFCNQHQGTIVSPTTHARLCGVCLLNMYGNVQMQSMMKMGLIK